MFQECSAHEAFPELAFFVSQNFDMKYHWMKRNETKNLFHRVDHKYNAKVQAWRMPGMQAIFHVQDCLAYF